MIGFSQSTKRIAPVVTFGTLVIAIYSAFIFLVQNRLHLLSHDALVIGITLDLMLTIPVLFYFLVVRPFKLPILTLVPVLFLSFLGASWILPTQHQWAVKIAEWVIIPLELGLIGWMTVRVLRTIRAVKNKDGADLLVSSYTQASELISQPKLAAMFSTELAIFIYGLFSFGQRPHVPAGSKPFYYHRNNALSAIIFALLFLLVIEGVALHIFISRWFPLVAWILSLLTLYSMIWLWADLRACKLRPLIVADSMLLLRAGMRWTVELPKAQVKVIATRSPENPKQALNLSLFSAPNLYLYLNQPVICAGPYGFRKQTSIIGLHVDEPGAFIQACDITRQEA